MRGRGVVGAVVNNIWSFGDLLTSNDRTNELMLNPFFSYRFWRWMVGRIVAKYHGKLDR